eukprot:366029-Chlamydomonas_euryale.AAC.24
MSCHVRAAPPHWLRLPASHACQKCRAFHLALPATRILHPTDSTNGCLGSQQVASLRLGPPTPVPRFAAL